MYFELIQLTKKENGQMKKILLTAVMLTTMFIVGCSNNNSVGPVDDAQKAWLNDCQQFYSDASNQEATVMWMIYFGLIPVPGGYPVI